MGFPANFWYGGAMETRPDENKGHYAARRDSAALYQIWGWVLFIFCALFFIGSGFLNGDLLTLAGSVLFLIACILFLIPLLAGKKGR
jgi:hypothetical protein